MKLTRKQELALIDIGLRIHLDKTLLPKEYSRGHYKKREKRHHNGHKWSRKQKAKFLKTMRAKFVEKRKKNEAA